MFIGREVMGLGDRFILTSMRYVLRFVLVAVTALVFLSRVESSPLHEAARQVADTTDDEASAPKVALVTFGPGENYWERFGHDAIIVDDKAIGKRIAYNYGVFDFQESHFLLNFARGHMHYSLDSEPLDEDLEMYVADGRSVTVQMLNLTPAQARQLTTFLAWNVQPQNAAYQYDYFTNNCSTKLRDVLNSALGGELERQLASRPAPHTYRFDGVRMMSPDLWLALGLNMALGPKADRPLSVWQESFVPMVLSDALDAVVVRDADGNSLPLVSQRQVVFPGSLPPPPAEPREFRLPFLGIGLGLATALLCLARGTLRLYRATFAFLAVTWWTVCGLSGLLLVGLWAFSDHWAAWENENLLLLSPLCLALPIVWWRAPRFGRCLAILVAASALIGLVVRTLPGLYQSNLGFVALTLPVHVALAALAWVSGTKTRPNCEGIPL